MVLVVVLLNPHGNTFSASAPPQPDIGVELRHLLDDGAQAPASEALRTFYSARAYRPVWCGGGELSGQVGALWEALQHADRDGLDPSDYAIERVRIGCGADTVQELARQELLLSDTLARYMQDLGRGKLEPCNADPTWHLIPPRIEPVEWLQQAAKAGALAGMLNDLPSPLVQYRRLRRALAKYRRLAERGGWPRIPPGPKLEVGVQHPQVHTLRQRLRLTGDLVVAPVSDGTHFDEHLHDAVQRFQFRHGLAVDGVVGPATRAAANVSVEARIAQLRVNLERLRWLPRDLGQRYVTVNTAGFWLDVMEGDETVLSMPVIIGKPYRATPSFASTIRYLVINPDWVVPPRITREDLIPQQRRNPDYFADKGIRIYSDWTESATIVDPASIDWTQYRSKSAAFKLVQLPGPKNALGRIKFMLPNRFDIYLHDTPDRHYFQNETRIFSSGCIRLAEPISLAEYLLEDDSQWTQEDILTLIFTGETRRLDLPSPIPIYLLYRTAWVSDDDNVHFRADIYGRDLGVRAGLGAL